VFCLSGVSSLSEFFSNLDKHTFPSSSNYQTDNSEIENDVNGGGGMMYEEFDTRKFENYSTESIQYFKEIACGRELSADGTTIQRWTTDVKIYVHGSNPMYLSDELERIVSELNEIIIPINIEVVSDPTVANLHIYYCSHTDFAEIKNEDITLLENNLGLFRLSNNSAYMYVDIYRANELEQKHLLREELTQSLGLFDDSYKYPESIFYQGWTTTTEYAPIDRELIDMLYNN